MNGRLTEARELLRGLAAGVPAGEGRVHLLRHGTWAELVLDHPGARHALSLAMMRALGDAVAALVEGPEVAVVLRSTGPTFCAGGDLKEVRSHWGTPEGGLAVARSMTVILDALLDLPQVVVAVVQGAAIGGGAELTTAADHRVFGPEARVEFRQVKLGVAAGWGGVGRLALHVPRPVAVDWLLRGGSQSPSTLGAAGYGDAVTGDPREAALSWLEPVLAAPPAAVRAAKAQIVASRPWGQRDAETDAFGAVWGGPAHRRALGLD